MFRYTINCYDYDRTVGAVNPIRVIVTAPNETEARHAAVRIAVRQNYAVEAIEDVTDRKIAKINSTALPTPRKTRKIR